MRYCTLAIMLLSICGCVAQDRTALSITDFELNDAAVQSESQETTVELTKAVGVTQGQQALQLNLAPGPYPGVFFQPQQTDWSAYSSVRFDVWNANDFAVTLFLRVDDIKSTNYASRFTLGSGIPLNPGANTVDISLMQMRKGTRDTRGIDLANIKSVYVFLNKQDAATRLCIDNIRLQKGDALAIEKELSVADKPVSIQSGAGTVLFKEQDWRSYDCLQFEIVSQDAKPLQYSFRIDDKKSTNYGSRFNMDARFVNSGRNYYEIAVHQLAHGTSSSRGLHIDQIKQMVVFPSGTAKAEAAVQVENMRLTKYVKPDVATKNLLQRDGKKLWSANSDTTFSEIESGIQFHTASGKYPGLQVDAIGNLYGYDLLRLKYSSTDTAYRSVNLKFANADGEATSLITGVMGEGVLDIPVSLIGDMSLADINNCTIFFDSSGGPEEFVVHSFEAISLAATAAAPANASFSLNLQDVTGNRNTAFMAKLFIEQEDGSYRRSSFTSTDKKQMNPVIPYNGNGEKQKAILNVYFGDHGAWDFYTLTVELTPDAVFVLDRRAFGRI
ncbi:MAG: hypothetical protein HRU15_01970 [Planctomycetes bacterium]|nr:hypothetical protein [Planctomycetota bacterium]